MTDEQRSLELAEYAVQQGWKVRRQDPRYFVATREHSSEHSTQAGIAVRRGKVAVSYIEVDTFDSAEAVKGWLALISNGVSWL